MIEIGREENFISPKNLKDLFQSSSDFLIRRKDGKIDSIHAYGFCMTYDT